MLLLEGEEAEKGREMVAVRDARHAPTTQHRMLQRNGKESSRNRPQRRLRRTRCWCWPMPPPPPWLRSPTGRWGASSTASLSRGGSIDCLARARKHRQLAGDSGRSGVGGQWGGALGPQASYRRWVCSALYRKCDPTVPCPANFTRTQNAALPSCIIKTCQVAAGPPLRVARRIGAPKNRGERPEMRRRRRGRRETDSGE